MKARHIVWALVLTLAVGTAHADFWLNDSAHLDVTTDHRAGELYGRSSVNIYGGSISDYLHAHDYSTVNIYGGSISDGGLWDGLYAYDRSTVNISGGSIFVLHAWHSSTVNIPGGNIFALDIQSESTVDISGGAIDNLMIQGGKAVLHGYDFQATGFAPPTTPSNGLSLIPWGPDGDYSVVGVGVLTGKWFDGTAWTIPIEVNTSNAMILLDVPEPAALCLLALGGLTLLRRRKA
jgi:hypothetical protein